MAYKNPVKKKENDAKYYEENKEKRKEYRSKRQEELKQRVVIFITTGEITEQKKWNMWCNEIKRCAKNKKHPYSGDFTNDIIFDMMIQGCFYCGNIATTIDRIDSTLEHTLDNCVASCEGCNYSKGAADPATFIRKAYYRSREEYADDITDIWFINKQKPSMWHYKKSADKKGVVFDLTKEYFENIIKDNCKYCQRSPTTWFGIDRVKPEYGYVDNNIVTCCYDCNLDKHVNDIDVVKKRNE
jgi:5-methylcytosine-specific restriction endonuclease McrA